MFFSQEKNALFWLIISLVIGYFAIVFAFKPYKINVYYFATYFVTLLFFIWSMLVKWDTKKIITVVTALGIYLVIFGFAEWLTIRPTRIQGPLMVATAYAVVLVLIWTIWFVESCFSRRFSYLTMFFGTSLVFIAVLLSGTRMGAIGIAMGLLFGIGFSNWVSKLKNNTFLQRAFYSMFIIGFVLFFIFIVWTLVPDEFSIKSGLNKMIAGKMDSSNMGRVTSWIAALNAFQDNKIWGIGPGNFRDVHKLFLQSIPDIGVPHAGLKHSHNMYLMILSEFGLVGFSIFCFILAVCFIQLFFRMRNNNEAGIYYAFLSSGIIMMTLAMVDIIPLDLYTIGWGAWYMGVLASFSFKHGKTAK